MRKFSMVSVLSLVLVSFTALGAFAQKDIDTEYSTETIKENDTVVYTFAADNWTKDESAEDKIVLTKRLTSGSGEYSEFCYDGDNVAFSYGTSYEFLYDDRLIAHDKYSLKFYSVRYNPEVRAFEKKKLSEARLQALFDDVKIIYVSEFKNNKYHLRKAPFKSQKILLVNDTPEYFYRYSFKGKNFEEYNIMGLLEINKMGKIKFSHPAPEFRDLYINVRPL